MRIEFRLKQILAAAKISASDTEISQKTKLHRHTVRKIMNNEATTVDLPTLQLICAWLQQRGCGDGLPGRLLGFRPSALLEAMVAPGRVKFWLGEYREKRPEGAVRARVSRDDTNVFARIIQRLCTMPATGAPRPQLSFEFGHVPLHVPPEGRSLDGALIEQDRDVGERAARQLKEDRPVTSVLIGSQQANFLQECFVAGMFRCQPYRAPKEPLPFYLRFHEPARCPSCFGGNAPPPGAADLRQPGIYYRHHGDRAWKFFPYVPLKRGTGIVIVRRNPGRLELDLSIFGLTGISTAAMGWLLCNAPESFWPEEGTDAKAGSAVYVCGFELASMNDWEQDIDSVKIRGQEIVPLKINPAPRSGR